MSSPAIPSARNLALRSRMLQAVREWFWSAGFIEVETPVRIPAPAPELHIQAPASGSAWLRTSPELHMKRLLAAGCGRIFQIGPCFREGERGRRHAPEFTMLEWYRAPADYRDILRDTGELVRHVVRQVTGGTTLPGRGVAIDVAAPWELMTVREAFRKHAGWDPVTAYDADRFDTDTVNRIEPALPRDRPCVLLDYPAPAAALARLKPADPSVAERWELYIGGLEIANAYSELTDAAAQRARFEACNAERQRLGQPAYPLDEPFLEALAGGVPPCGGIALGIDRLAMLLADATAIDDIRPFCAPRAG
jgi:lysyl-tRNA synthetase class 2